MPRIDVTQAHIDAATRGGDGSGNPIAIAIRAAMANQSCWIQRFAGGGVTISVGRRFIDADGGHRWIGVGLEVPQLVKRFCDDFDAASSISPFSFNLDYTAR